MIVEIEESLMKKVNRFTFFMSKVDKMGLL